ncbi:hypothetical protein KI809_16045 [Geobacter pelophilus]|uniref:Phage gp6-like head-tail connector protein n=1 Tax=Geoanaerobacter pelophilus TaxID=60036 RepID=A0AAW4L6M1_9BACT|nr:hypothetical protein [Geoanaerobacter pelophilus]MBT0665822.1 hypothetical protein [Geoanaerobacter pelophilus]
MTPHYRQLNATEILDLYFIENRARLLDIASFLDRIDRYEGSDEAKADFRYQALVNAAKLLHNSDTGRTVAIQNSFSDPSTEPLESAIGLKAVGAWDGGKQ